MGEAGPRWFHRPPTHNPKAVHYIEQEGRVNCWPGSIRGRAFLNALLASDQAGEDEEVADRVGDISFGYEVVIPQRDLRRCITIPGAAMSMCTAMSDSVSTSLTNVAAGVFVNGRDGTLQFFDARGFQPVYAFHAVEVGVCRDYLLNRQPLHHRSMERTPGSDSRIAIHQLGCQSNVLSMDGFNTPPHCLGEWPDHLPRPGPIARRPGSGASILGGLPSRSQRTQNHRPVCEESWHMVPGRDGPYRRRRWER